MNSNHSIDVEAERNLFEAEYPMLDLGWMDAIKSYSYLETDLRWAGWLAAKRSIAANTGTIDSDEFCDLLTNYADWAGINFDSDPTVVRARSKIIAHIDARLNAATTETPCKKN